MTEIENLKLRLIRRISKLDGIISYMVKKHLKRPGICKYGSSKFIDSIVDDVCHDIYFQYFLDIDDSSDEWGEVYQMLENIIKDNYQDKITKIYENYC